MSSTNSRAPRRRRSVFTGLLGVFLIVLSGAYFLHRYPLRIPAQADREKPADFLIQDSPLEDTEAQVTLLVDTSIIRQRWSRGALSQADFSYGWANTLEQEFGYFDIRDINETDSAKLAESRIVVFSASALASLAEAAGGYSLMYGFISAGGVAILDYPDDKALALLRLARQPVESQRQKLSRRELRKIIGHSADETSLESLPDSLPLFSSIQAYAPSHRKSPELPVSNVAHTDEFFDYIRYGAGGALLTKWDFGRWVTLTQQGLPDEQLRAGNRYRQFGHSDKLETNDLVADSSYLNTTYPWVDILEKTLGNFIAGVRNAPRWFTAPGSSAGVFMMTHDDEGLGDAGVWMNAYESRRGYPSTSFVMLSDKLSADGIRSLVSNGAEIGLHWNRFDRKDKAALETIGVARWRPLLRRRNLSSQSAWLDSLGVKTSYNRNHYFLWDANPYQPFRALSAAGFTMDYSYGPDLSDKGYLFGGAFPFHPLDANGASFRLTETPVTWTENFGGADSAWIHQLLADNAQRYHGVINALYHNNTFAWAPDYSIYSSWRQSYRVAQMTGHTLFSACQLERFLRARTESVVNWQSDSETVEVYCNTTQTGLALIAPLGGLNKPTATLHDTVTLRSAISIQIDSVRILDSLYWRIALPQGRFWLSFERRENSREGSR